MVIVINMHINKSGELTDDVSENHIDNPDPDDKLASVLTMQVMMKTQI